MISGITGPAATGGIIGYLNLPNGATLGTGRLVINGSNNGNLYLVDTTAINLLETELNTGAGADLILIANAGVTANGVISPIDLNSQGGADFLLISDIGDVVGNVFHMDDTTIGGGALGAAVSSGGLFGPNGIIFYDNDLEILDVSGPDGVGLDNTYNVEGVPGGASGVGTTAAAGTVGITDGQGNATFNIQADELSAAASFTFNGNAGTDVFNVFFADGAISTAAAFLIGGQTQNAGINSRDEVNINTTADTGAS